MARFTTAARTIDMLGRQQIAGIPTAINELFKNAYDAYAKHVVVDYLSDRSTFVLRDDGTGMTEQDFLRRWLTVGTDSKAGGALGAPPTPAGVTRRPILGEKGIGRLAIAALGPQTVMLTRLDSQLADGVPQPTTVALLQWTLFTAPGLTLDDIDIPTATLPSGAIIDVAMLQGLAAQVRSNVLDLESRITVELRDRVLEQLDALQDFDPAALAVMPGPSLAEEGHGTQFIVVPTDESVADAVGAADSSKSASQLVKLLIGFSNTMVPDAPPPAMRTSFVERRDDGTTIDLIADSEFFTPQDFELVDHQFTGTFDDRGTFRGDVTIYGGDPIDHVVAWPAGRGMPTRCGPFGVRFGYVQGDRKQSQLSPEDHALITSKLDRIAGLYVYRDRIRILPYGNSDVDYLGIEDRRSRNAGYYFFSYRRMFGAIELSSQFNPDLQEKAGREGFRENIGYRQFRLILENFFVQLAADFFRDSGQYGPDYLAVRKDLERSEQVRRRREVNIQGQRRQFRNRLEKTLGAFAAREPAQAVDHVLDELARDIRDIERSRPPTEQTRLLLKAEDVARQSLDRLRLTYQLSRPVGVGLSRTDLRDMKTYERQYAELTQNDLVESATRVTQLVTRASAQSAPEEFRTAVVAAARASAAALQSRWVEETDGLLSIAEAAYDYVLAAARAAVQVVGSAAAGLDTQLNEALNARRDDAFLVDLRQRLEADLENTLEAERSRLRALRAQLNALMATELDSADDQLAALEEEVLVLREQADADLELTQLGRAIELINHEFSATIRTVRRNLQSLRSWGRANPKLGQLEQDLSAAFEHLDAYLALFTPLQRRLYRRPIQIQGHEISRYISDLFGERLSRHGVTLEMSEQFEHATVVGYPSTFYPVFVNLIDNAIFWLSDRPHPRRILLDARAGEFIVSDNGPGISERDRDAIFELGFSRKPSGRGLGLKISADVLRRSGWRLSIAEGGGLEWPDETVNVDGIDVRRTGAAFILSPPAGSDLESRSNAEESQ